MLLWIPIQIQIRSDILYLLRQNILDLDLTLLTANASIATVLDSIPAFSDTVKSEGQQMSVEETQ
jgi:hypothetical protein